MPRANLIVVLLSLLVSLSCVSLASAAIKVTAANLATAPSDAKIAAIVEITGSTSNQFDSQLAQTFLSNNTGILQSVSITTGARAGAAQSDGLGLRMAIAPFNPENGLLGEVLAIEPIENVELLPGFSGPFSQSDALQASANFDSSEIVLEAGSSYAMIFSAECLGDSFFILGGPLPEYEEGLIGGRSNDESFRFRLRNDLFFEVTVDVVPEPASLAMIFTMLPVILRRRKLSTFDRTLG